MRAFSCPAAALLAFALLAAAAPPAAAAPVPAECGAALADYVGTADPDTAFTGFLDESGARVPFALIPKDVAGTVRAEIGGTGVESAATVKPAWDGSAMIAFDTPRGHAESDAVECLAPEPGDSTRVTQIFGTVLVGRDHLAAFALTRT